MHWNMNYMYLSPSVHLLITFENSSDPDLARQNVGPDLDPNCLRSDDIPVRIF